MPPKGAGIPEIDLHADNPLEKRTVASSKAPLLSRLVRCHSKELKLLDGIAKLRFPTFPQRFLSLLDSSLLNRSFFISSSS